jgi:phosphoribosylglycinamide formyltransferase-1
MMRVGVLASGSGSNLKALIDALNVPDSPAHVTVAISDVPGAPALEKARAADVAAVLMEPKRWPTRAAFDEAVAEELRRHAVELVCLAGYMRLVSGAFLRHFEQRVINVHPALLPSFKGLHGARQALDAGVRITGCTVHFVDEGMDSGPIIAQAAVPVLPDDTEESLQARIQREEHRLYPRVVNAIALGKVQVAGRLVRLKEALP